MSFDEFTIRVEGLSKRFEIYAQPVDRLKQMLLPRVHRVLHRREHAYFREFWALRNVAFDVHRGETVGIVGRNGSGKSTLLQLICGTLTPTAGSIRVHGRVAALLELGSGFNPEFTGRENVYLNAAVLGLTKDEIDSRYSTIVKFADIGQFIEQPVKTYSSGMYVRLAFAVAINVSPDILIVDEALSVGDEAFQRKCFARLDTIRDNGATILFVSHAAGKVIELCDRAILLDSGEMLAMGTPKFVVSRYHKLLYAAPARAETVRAAIRTESSLANASCADDIANAHTVRAARGVTELQSAYLDEGLVPKSTIRYESRGARIHNPHIETLDGRIVNVLVPRSEYVYCYDVSFARAAAGVRLGMMIKTITGLELGGAATAPNFSEGEVISAGQALSVKFNFKAMLASGVYFMNAGVIAMDSTGETFLDRIMDVLMFRVVPDINRLATGTVDFAVSSGLHAVEMTVHHGHEGADVVGKEASGAI
ncbi:MAG TPA: ABC transporter ATP-binding protein [Rhodanobacteraceae bacterium]